MTEPSSLLYIDGKVEPARLAALIGVSPTNLYQEHQKGMWGPVAFTEMTYIEALTIYRKKLIHSEQVKIEKEITKREEVLAKENTRKELEFLKLENKKQISKEKKNYNFSEMTDEDGNSVDMMHPLLKAKITQEIKLKKVQEVQGWMRIAIDKNDLPNYPELLQLLFPFVQIIKNSLVAIGLDFPETQERIDSCLNGLADFGDKVFEIAKEHEKSFVDEMLKREIDDKLIELVFLPKD